MYKDAKAMPKSTIKGPIGGIAPRATASWPTNVAWPRKNDAHDAIQKAKR